MKKRDKREKDKIDTADEEDSSLEYYYVEKRSKPACLFACNPFIHASLLVHRDGSRCLSLSLSLLLF